MTNIRISTGWRNPEGLFFAELPGRPVTPLPPAKPNKAVSTPSCCRTDEPDPQPKQAQDDADNCGCCAA